MLRILKIIEDTTVDGPGFRTAIYCAGCAHACLGCQNPQSWDFSGGHEMSTDELMAVIEADPYAHVTFSGGDPFYQAEGFAELARAIRQRCPGKTIWCYTGFRYEQLTDEAVAPRGAGSLLSQLDVLVDGPYIASLHDPDLQFRGSSNQRIIDVPASLRAGVPMAFSPDVQ